MTFLSKQNMGGLAADPEGPDHSGIINSVTMSSDGGTVVSGSLDKTLRVYTLRGGGGDGGDDGDGAPHHQVLTGCTGEVMSVSLSFDAMTVAGGSKDGAVRVWRRSTKDAPFEPLGSGPVEKQHGVTGGGSKLDALFMSSSSSATAVATGNASMGVGGHTDQLRAAYVSLTRGGRRVVFTCGHDPFCCVWDLVTGALLGKLPGHEGIVSCVSTNDGATLAVSGGADLVVRVWTIDADAPTFVGTLKHAMKGATKEICNTAMSPDGRFALTVGFDDAARFWDPVAGVALFTLEGNGGWVGGASISADNVAVFSCGDKLCKLVDCESGKVLRTLAGHEEGVLRCEISRDGSTVITCAFDNTSRVFDAATGEQRHVLERGHSTYVENVYASEDGSVGLTVSTDRVCRVWDLRSGAISHTFVYDAGLYGCVYCSETGDVVVGANDGSTLFLTLPVAADAHAKAVGGGGGGGGGEARADADGDGRGQDGALGLWRDGDGPEATGASGSSGGGGGEDGKNEKGGEKERTVAGRAHCSDADVVASHAAYLRRHDVDDLLGGMLHDIVTARPPDPLQFMIDCLTLGKAARAHVERLNA